MGLLSKVAEFLNRPGSGQAQTIPQGYTTFTESSPTFVAWDGNLYEQAKTRAIVERIATACSKLKPEFVTPEGSAGPLPRVQRLFTSWPNEMMSWPTFQARLATLMYVDTTAFIVPGYDRDHNVTAIYPLKPLYTELVEYEGEPWLRFHLATGETVAYEFYSVGILTRFQLESDIFGGGNVPLTPTLRLMDAQRQAEEIALKTGANIRFIGKLAGLVHEKDMDKKRERFSESNLGIGNKSGLLLYDQTFEDIKQINNQPVIADAAATERIDKALYAYFGINEAILTNSYDEATWAAFYEGCVEPFGLRLSSALTRMLLTPTQVRKGSHVMFSAGYLEYSTTDAKTKVVQAMMDRGIFSFNEARDVYQLPHIPGGDTFMIRGEYYLVDGEHNILAESGGKSDHSTEYHEPGEYDDDFNDLDEPAV